MKLFGLAFLLLTYIYPQTGVTKSLYDQFLRHGVIITNNSNNILTIEYPNGNKRNKSLEYPVRFTVDKTSIDSIGFDIGAIDTSLYSDKYTFWQETPIGISYSTTPIIGDINKNGRPELYGWEKNYSTPASPAEIYELDTLNIFKKMYQFPDTVSDPAAIIDLENDGNSEIAMHAGYFAGSRILIYKKTPQVQNFPTTQFSQYVRRNNVSNSGSVFGDFDKNGKTDVVYWNGLDVFIDEFNPMTQSFDTIFAFRPIINAIGDFTVGDFDMDGKTDIVFGNVKDDVYMIEAVGEHQYQVVWQSKVQTYNAYLNFKTNDIDANGKPEFWIGGDGFFNGIGMTRYTCFESDGDNSYHAVARIDLIGVFSFSAGNCFAKDVDGDGKEELFICLDGHVLIFKFTGSKNSHNYKLIFAKRKDMDMANQNSVIYGATLYNITGDGKDELLINMDHVINGLGRRDFSRIYKLQLTTTVRREKEMVPTSTELFQNYPNPFNPSTTIRFRISGNKNNHVVLKIYNVLGKEIKELFNQQFDHGEYNALWNGTDNNNTIVESGVYFVSLQTPDYRKTIKTIFIK